MRMDIFPYGFSSPERFRLPGTVVPTHYRLTLEPNLKNLTFIGSVEIDIIVREKTDTVMLHAKEIGVTAASVKRGGNEVPIRAVQQDIKKMELSLDLGECLNAGEEAVVSLQFSGVLNDQMDGFYRSKYTVASSNIPRTLATTQFEEIGARRAFPCFDEPTAKAEFDVTLLVPCELDAVSNMPVLETTDLGDGRKRMRFGTSPKMSTYLLAFTVGEIESIEGRTSRGTIVRVLTTPGKKEQGRFALDVGIRALEFYEDYFCIPYPLPKLDMAAIPDFAAGAMENWGLITYRESALLVDPAHSSAATKQRVAIVVAHEIAHQWFGNLVTMDWWNQLWLNEGFATWMEYHAVDALFPEWNIWEQFLDTDHALALEADGLQSTHAIEVPPGSVEAMRQNFDAVSYSKGGSVIRMIHGMIGPEAFRKGLQTYLVRHAYGNTVTEDLWAALEEASGKPVGKIMDTWTKQPGYPVVNADTGEHQRFLVSGAPLTEAEAKQQWRFELSAKNGKSNAGQTALVRVNYAPEQWKELIERVHARAFAPIDRFGLVDDLRMLARAGHAPPDLILSLLRASRGEPSYLVWKALRAALKDILPLVPRGTEAERNFNLLARDILRSVVTRLDWERMPNDTHADTLLRPLVLELYGKFGDERTVTEARRRFGEHCVNKGSLEPNLRVAVYGIVAHSGGKETHATLTDLYRTAERSEEKQRYLTALGEFQEQALLEETISFVLSNAVRAQDVPSGLGAVAENPHGSRIAWEAMAANWKEIRRQFGPGIMLLSRLVENVLKHLGTFKEAEEVEEFFRQNPAPEANQAVARALERIRGQATWVERGREPVTAWLLGSEGRVD